MAAARTSLLLDEFFRETTCEPLNRLYLARLWPNRLFWLALLLGGVGLSCYGCVKMFNDYMAQPYVTMYAYDDSQTAIKLPSILLCSPHWISNTRVKAFNMSQSLLEYLLIAFTETASMIAQEASHAPWEWDALDAEYHTFRDREDVPSTQAGILREIAFNCEETFITCRFMALRFNCCNSDKVIIRPQLTTYGVCYFMKVNLNQSMPGPTPSLSVVVRNNEENTSMVLYGANVENAVMVNLMEYYTPIFYEPVPAPFRTKTYISVRPTRQLDKENCIDSEFKKLRYFSQYTFENCIYECKVEDSMQHCNCSHFLYIDESLPLTDTCHPDKLLKCFFRKDRFVHMLSDAHEICSRTVCKRQCNYYEYNQKVYYAPYSDRKIAFINSQNMPYNSEAAELQLYDTSTMGALQALEVSTGTPDTFLGNIGGQLGLWLGMSVVSIAHALSYLIQIAHARVRQYLAPYDRNAVAPTAKCPVKSQTVELTSPGGTLGSLTFTK